METNKYQDIYDEVNSGVYERFYTPKPGDYVLDIGAHVGYFTERVAQMVGPEGRVFAFEPENENFGRLVQLVGKRDNVRLDNRAVWSCDGTAVLFRAPENSGGHSLTYAWEHGDHVLVRTVAIDELWDSDQISHVNFMKIDCEGSELQVLYGAEDMLEDCRPHIALEIHSTALHAQVARFLRGFSYIIQPDVPTIGVCYAIPPGAARR